MTHITVMNFKVKCCLVAKKTMIAFFLFTILFGIQHGTISDVYAAPPTEPPATANTPEEKQDDDALFFQKELEGLQEGQILIQKELQEIKQLLKERQQAPAAPPADDLTNKILNVKGDAFHGAQDAKLTLIEFSDYQCPFCARYFRDTFPSLLKEYIQAGKVKYIFRDFPLTSIHKEAFQAAEAAECAGDHGQFWAMHDWMFSNQDNLGKDMLLQQAEKLGLAMPRFRSCLEEGQYRAEVQNDLDEGQQAGVRGTPTFFIGLTGANDGTVKPVHILRGAQSYTRFKEVIDGLLAQ